MWKALIFIPAVAALWSPSGITRARADEPASAACADREEIVRKLAERFGETRTGIGLRKADRLVEVFSSAVTGTWTIVVTDAGGGSCLIAAGRRWTQAPERIPARIPPPSADAEA